ncbi:MAG TPA: patatin-like phospholipase family protein [Bacilli bacterium]|nr:patatin-like phospholipase family protein [Bacilli bacterium]
MKLGLALGSGGSKGAYQVGFFQALKELKMPYHVITGASIGALNGAIMAGGDLPMLEKLWHNLEVKKVMKHGINLDLDEILRSDKKELLKFIASYIKNKGMDISPFKSLIAEHLDIDKLLKAPVDFAITVATYPKMVGKDIIIKDVKREEIADYLLASASCYPAFPVTKIGEENYIDGAYYDRLPIDLAFRLGSDHVIAVDLNTVAYSHPEYLDKANVTYIRSYHHLGPFLMIKPDIMARNMRLGYLDTMKKFGKYLGFKYTFKITAAFDKKASEINHIIAKAGIEELDFFLTSKIHETMTDRTRYLRFLEIIAEAADLDPLKIYEIPQLTTEIDQAISVNMHHKNWINKRPGEQQLRLQTMRKAARLGMIKQIALEKLELPEATKTMLAMHFPELYFTAIYYGLVK